MANPDKFLKFLMFDGFHSAIFPGTPEPAKHLQMEMVTALSKKIDMNPPFSLTADSSSEDKKLALQSLDNFISWVEADPSFDRKRQTQIFSGILMAFIRHNWSSFGSDWDATCRSLSYSVNVTSIFG